MTISLSYRHDTPTLNGGRKANGHLVAAYADSDFVLRNIVEALDLTPAKLGRLVGRGVNKSYAWFSGGVAPSQAYWVRISYLQHLVISGVNLARVRTIDWGKLPYQIEWWPGAEPVENEGVNNSAISESRPKGKDVVRVTWGDIPTQSG